MLTHKTSCTLSENKNGNRALLASHYFSSMIVDSHLLYFSTMQFFKYTKHLQHFEAAVGENSSSHGIGQWTIFWRSFFERAGVKRCASLHSGESVKLGCRDLSMPKSCCTSNVAVPGSRDLSIQKSCCHFLVI